MVMPLELETEVGNPLEAKIRGDGFDRPAFFEHDNRTHHPLFIQPTLRAAPKALSGDPFQLPSGHAELLGERPSAILRLAGQFDPLFLIEVVHASHIQPIGFQTVRKGTSWPRKDRHRQRLFVSIEKWSVLAFRS